ncbi:Disulfide bond isomerase, DsbC/G [Wenzhouxiangella marina]|uniref:Thiol:disulfide interchange protein n=2 Tax=Wenzhouxiangella marina TaxID=1579979 RepID=A0A0K0XV53_9GAMM|nr:Disulfide bond isomerase, DsbC/G [Wenzhouxiangella marina]
MKPVHLLLALGAMLISHSALADDFQRVQERLATLVGGDVEVSVASTRIDGIVQVTAGTEVFFMTDDGQYFIQGRLVDLNTQDDLTELGKQGVRRQLMRDLDTSTLITYGPTDPDHEVLVFTDTDCGYCRRLHGMIDEYIDAGIAVRYAAFPRAGIGSSTYDDLVSVWCAADVNAAMDQAQLGRSLPAQDCDSPVERHFELGRMMGVNGTPYIITANGEMFGGIVAAEDLRRHLDETGADGP